MSDTGDVYEPSAEAAAAAEAGDAVQAAATDVEHDVEAILLERDQFKEIALRLQADFENYRKRAATQQIDEIDRATGKMAEAILPVLDACEAAFAHGVQGVESIWSALIGVLQKQGLEALDLAAAGLRRQLHVPPVPSERRCHRRRGRSEQGARIRHCTSSTSCSCASRSSRCRRRRRSRALLR